MEQQDTERLVRMAGEEVEVGEWPVYEGGNFKTLWVATLDGVLLRRDEESPFRFDTPEAAREFGRDVRSSIRARLPSGLAWDDSQARATPTPEAPNE